MLQVEKVIGWTRAPYCDGLVGLDALLWPIPDKVPGPGEEGQAWLDPGHLRIC